MHPFLKEVFTMEKIKIGVIVNTHGLKGEVKVKSFSDFNDIRFCKGNYLMLAYHGELINLKINSSREHKGMLLLTFEGLNNIDQVEKYRDCELFIDKNDLHELDEDEVYYFDLMGCQVYLEDGSELGYVNDVLETGANAVLRVNDKILIPYVKAFIKEADIKNKKIVIYKVDGLL